jgi:hypothetical protein
MPPLDPYNFWKPDPDQNQKPDPDPHQTQNSGAVEVKNGEVECLLLAVADFHHLDEEQDPGPNPNQSEQSDPHQSEKGSGSASLCFGPEHCVLNNSSVLQCGVHELLRRGGLHKANF